MNNEWQTASTGSQDCDVTITTGQKVIERADVKSLRKCKQTYKGHLTSFSRPAYMLRPSISAIASRLSA